MSLRQQIESDIKTAMLAKNKEELLTLRSIKSMILLAETEKGAADVLSEEAEMKILTKAVKQRRESADIYAKENRQELADKELVEAEIIERYLPKQLTDAEVKSEVQAIISQTGAAGMKDMGKVMGMATKKMAGKADGKLISQMVKDLLSA